MTPAPPQGWLSKSEAQALIAASAPNAPQHYKFRNIRSGRARPHLRTMVRGNRLYIHKADLLREIEQHPFITSAAPLRPIPPGYITTAAAQAIIAASGPYAPQNYRVNNLIHPGSPRSVRHIKIGHRLYISEADLRREMHRLPFYDRSNAISRRACCTAPFHPHLPPGADPTAYLTIRQAAAALGEKLDRLRGMVRSYTLRAYSHQGRLVVHPTEALQAAAARTDQFIRSLHRPRGRGEVALGGRRGCQRPESRRQNAPRLRRKHRDHRSTESSRRQTRQRAVSP